MNNVKMVLRELKFNYLLKVKTEGGYKQEFIEYVRQWISMNPDDVAALAEDSFVSAASVTWRDPLTPKTPNINEGDLMIGGSPVPTEIRYRDKSVTGGYRTVLIRYATFDQWHKSLLAKEEEHQKAGLSIKDERDTYLIGMERAGNDINSFVFNSGDQFLGNEPLDTV